MDGGANTMRRDEWGSRLGVEYRVAVSKNLTNIDCHKTHNLREGNAVGKRFIPVLDVGWVVNTALLHTKVKRLRKAQT